MIPLLLALLGGCPRPTGPGPSLVLVEPDPPEVVIEREEVHEGDTWSSPDGTLHLRVPTGWSGWSVPAGSSLILALDHGPTGARLEVWSFNREGATPAPRPRPECEISFLDRGFHRAVPALASTSVATCEPDDPLQTSVYGWYGWVGDREVHMELLCPAGRVVEARAAAEPLLRGFTRHRL